MTEHKMIGTAWRHLKTDRVYTIVGVCRIEGNNEPAFLYELEPGEIVWARPMDEFLDGRFERVSI